MGSFFYGNPYGKNTGLYAYVASKMSPSISFGDSTFRKEKSEKITTARVVLGNIIKDSGCFYTYETSFFGTAINVRSVLFREKNSISQSRDFTNWADTWFQPLPKPFSKSKSKKKR